MSKARAPKDNVDKVFEVSLILKGLNGCGEIIGGIALIFVSPTSLNHLFKSLSQNPISSSDVTFGIFYLILHGLAKIGLVIAIFKQKLWAYPAMIIFLSVFIVYQVYLLVTKFSLILLLLTLFDTLLVGLTSFEYKRHQKLHKASSGANL